MLWIKTIKGSLICILNGEKCESKYTKCEDYNEDVTQDNRIKDNCEAVAPKNDANFKYCMLDTTNKVCETKRKPCDLNKNIDDLINNISRMIPIKDVYF